MSVTEQMIDAVLARKQTIDIGGFLYGNRHVIRDHEEERKRQDTVVLWELVTDDYEAGHTAATTQFERIYIQRLLEAAFTATPSTEMMREALEPSEWLHERLTPDEAWELLCNSDDRTSPEEYPDHALIKKEELASYMARAVCAPDLAAENARQHPDDLAVDLFAAAMKAKLAQKRSEGRGGWDDKKRCSQEYLSKMLHDHARKTDPVDIANFAMMLHQRGEIVFQDQEFEALRDEAKGYALKMLLQQNEIARLRAALGKISSPTQTTDLLWWQIEARAALADQKGGAA